MKTKILAIGIVIAVLYFIKKSQAEDQQISPAIAQPSSDGDLVNALQNLLSSVSPIVTPVSAAPVSTIQAEGPSNLNPSSSLDSVIANILKGITSVAEKALVMTGVFTSEFTQALPLMTAGAGQGQFTNPYSSWLDKIPMIGTVLAGFLEGIIGKKNVPATQEEAISNAVMDKLAQAEREEIINLGELASTEPYATMLKEAKYTEQMIEMRNWALPPGWEPYVAPEPISVVCEGAVVSTAPYVGETRFVPPALGLFGFTSRGYAIVPSEKIKKGMDLFTILNRQKAYMKISASYVQAAMEARAPAVAQ